MQTFVSIKPLFYVLRILSELIKFNQLTYSFDYLQGKLPESFTKIPIVWSLFKSRLPVLKGFGLNGTETELSRMPGSCTRHVKCTHIILSTVYC